MKKIMCYVGVLILCSFTTALIFIKQKNNVYDSVVYIESIGSETITNGSGLVYKVENNNTYILTSYHVIEGYSDIYIYNNKRQKVKAEIVNFDEYTDIAVLITGNRLDFKKINIANSDNINNNDKIYVVGTPISIENINTKVEGIILNSNKNITINTTHGSSNLNTIEVSSEVDYGNSGGPLLNTNNEIIGMMFVKQDINNKSYALPINFVVDIADKLISNNLKRPNLGAVMCNTTNDELLNQYEISIDHINGVVILEINEQGVLGALGLQQGDIITKFADKEIDNVNNLREELYKKEIGDTVEIVYYREGNTYNANIILQ